MMLLSCSLSSMGSLCRWVFSSFGGSFLLLLVCGSPSGVRCQCLIHPLMILRSGVFPWFAFCSLLGSPFFAAVPQLSSFSFCWPFTPFLSVVALPSLGGRSLYRGFTLALAFALLVGSSFLGLIAFCCSGLPSVRPPRPPLLGLLRFWPCVLLVRLLRVSAVSQFLRDGVLPSGRVCSVGSSSAYLSWLHGFCLLVFGSLPLLVVLLLFLLLFLGCVALFCGVSFLEVTVPIQ